MDLINSNVNLPISFTNNNQCRGIGQLSWLSSKAGLITCNNCSNKLSSITVSFQLKDFCDAGVTDLTSVLRVGFRLAFSAISPADSFEYIANYVSPVNDASLNTGVFNDTKELDLESIEQSIGCNARQAHKDPYSLEIELDSLSFLLSIFYKNSTHYIPLSGLHSRISNSGYEELYRYIGSSSLKRRQFIERRSYIFYIGENDVVFLQPPEIYTTVCLLSGFLLSHGGVTSSNALFSFFNSSHLVPAVVKESIKTNRLNFMEFLSRHPFAFAPFPSQFFVSVRRNLPYFDYNTFIKKNFPSCVYRPFVSTVSNFTNHASNSNFNNYDQLTDVTTVPPFHTPAPLITPLFQEDSLLAAQKAVASRATNGNPVWQNEIGFFETNNNIVNNVPGPTKVPIIGSTAIIGQSAVSGLVTNSNLFTNEIPKKVGFGKIDVTRNTELQKNNSLLLPIRKIFVDVETQTDETLTNTPNVVDRAVGPDKTCTCQCNCTKNINNSTINLNENLFCNQNDTNDNNFLAENNYLFSAIDFQQQRPFSVQDKPIQQSILPTTICKDTNSNNESASIHNVFDSTAKSLLDDLDTFFNHNFSFTPFSAAVKTTPYGFDVKKVSVLSANLDAGISNQQSNVNQSTVLKSLPMPIGMNNTKNKKKNENSSNKSNSLNSSSEERLYNPFGKETPFELKLSSLKL